MVVKMVVGGRGQKGVSDWSMDATFVGGWMTNVVEGVDDDH